MKKRMNFKKAIIFTLVVLIISIITVIVCKKNTVIKSMTITPELMRALQYEQFKDGDEDVDSTENVKFSAFFLRDLDGDGYAEKVKGTCKELGQEDTLYMELNVQTEGYLKNAKVEIQGQNFYFQTSLPKDEQLKDNYIGNNVKKIEFDKIVNGTQKLLKGIVRSGDYKNSYTETQAIGNNINNYSRNDNKIIFSGIYVSENGEETQITKEIPIIVDWYGKTETKIFSTSQSYMNLSNLIDDENGNIKLSFKVNASEIIKKLILKRNHVEGNIPTLNGFEPIEVSSTALGFTYDETTKKFVIDNEVLLNENGIISNSMSRENSYEIEIIYPLEAYQNLGKESITLEIPVSAYYEGYNNPNEQFKNPYKSNVASDVLEIKYYDHEKIETIYQTNLDIQVGSYAYSPFSRYIISKQKPLRIYNGVSEEEKDDTYEVIWKIIKKDLH